MSQCQKCEFKVIAMQLARKIIGRPFISMANNYQIFFHFMMHMIIREIIGKGLQAN